MSQTASALRPRNHNDQRRLLRAVKHVTYLWLPFNPEVIEELRDETLYKSASTNPEHLLGVLRRDCGLLAFLLVRLMQDVKETSLVPFTRAGPAPLLSSAGAERIKQLVAEGCQISSIHQLHTARPFQLSRLAETLVVASTVESLCRSRDIDSDTGFCKAVIRELGLNLVAWNYPSVFQAAIESLPKFHTIEASIKQLLGFSPEELAQALMFPSREPPNPNEQGVEPLDHILEDFIAIGRALARAEFPETYPSSNKDWSYACEYLKESLGKLFPAAVRDAVTRNSSSYYRIIPQYFRRLKNFDPARHHRSESRRSRLMYNPFVKQCPIQIQNALTSLYETMSESGPDQASLSTLLTKVIPQAGFTGGCLFLLSKRKGALIPGTMIGRVRALEIDSVPLVPTGPSPLAPLSSSGRTKSGPRAMIERAFISRRPIMDRFEHTGTNSEDDSLPIHIARFSATVGEKTPVGVLYLEKPLSDNPEEETNSLPTFRAINKSLSDALSID
jgi:hypothetical protein